MSAIVRHMPWVPLGALLLLAGCQDAAPPPPSSSADAKGDSPVRPGVYGNVAHAAGSGELRGMEVEVHEAHGQMIEVTLCEGGCDSIHRAPYQIEGDAISFAYRDSPQTSDGSPAPEKILSFKLTPQGDDVMAQGAWLGDAPVLLKRLPKRDGLTAAKESMRKKIGQPQ